ncbi:MAG: hypothetical protein ACOYI4_06040 [Christensenellales bacterium]|jgi:hypothetical protein
MDENKNLTPSDETDNLADDRSTEEKIYEGTVVDAPPVPPQDNEEEEEIPPPRIYTERKALQIALGIISAIVMWGLLFLSGTTSDGMLQWGWVIAFAAVMIGRRQIEKKYNVIFRTYALALLVAMVVCLVAAIAIYLVFPSILPEALFHSR